METPVETGIRPEREEELRPVRWIMEGSLAEGIAGACAVILAILGLAGVLPRPLLSISTIAIGLSLLFNGAAVAARFRTVLMETSRDRLQAVELGGGTTAEFVGGATGVALGILALLGLAPTVLIPVAAIVFGGALILGSGVTARLNDLEIARSQHREETRQALREAVSAAAGIQLLIGLGSVTLGILSLVGFDPMVLSLVAILGVGSAVLLSGTAITSRMLSVFHY